MQPVILTLRASEVWRLRRWSAPPVGEPVETHADERVSARIVMARLDAVLDRLDGVWEQYYAPVIEQRAPERREGR